MTIALARNAMATRFELVLNGENPIALRAAGEEALDEIERLEGQLSLFRPTSEIAHVNARAALEPVRVSPPVFSLLQHAARLSLETGGAFDVTVGPLVRAWGFWSGTGRIPLPAELAELRACVGTHLLEFDPAEYTIRFSRPGLMVDLGAIGKGYAIDCAVNLLREAGVSSALLHGGTSTVYALGRPPDAEAWCLGLPLPSGKDKGNTESSPATWKSSAPPRILMSEAPTNSQILKVSLKDESLSVSAPSGRSFRSEGKVLGHIIDPRSGRPAEGASIAAVVLPSATESDALSTALLTLGLEAVGALRELRSGMRTLVGAQAAQEFRISAAGFAGIPAAPETHNPRPNFERGQLPLEQ